MPRVWLVVCALACVAALGACAAPTPTAVPPTVTATTTRTLTPSATPSVTATRTLPPTVTPTATLTPSPTPPPLSVSVALSPGALGQGETGLVTLTASRACTLTGTLDGRTIGFGTEDGRTHYAFIGVHALAPPGQQALTLVARSLDGAEMRFATTLSIEARPFEDEEITFTPQIETLLDPKYTQPELERMQAIYATLSAYRHWTESFVRPLGGVTTSHFGSRRLYAGRLNSYHSGLDIDGEEGDPVVAAAPGIVVLADSLHVRGNTVVVDHGWGVLTGYSHLHTIDVAEGDVVDAGQTVGTVGATGLVTGSHLHWELRVGGIAVDPRGWLTDAVVPASP